MADLSKNRKIELSTTKNAEHNAQHYNTNLPALNCPKLSSTSKPSLSRPACTIFDFFLHLIFFFSSPPPPPHLSKLATSANSPPHHLNTPPYLSSISKEASSSRRAPLHLLIHLSWISRSLLWGESQLDYWASKHSTQLVEGSLKAVYPEHTKPQKKKATESAIILMIAFFRG